MSAQFFAQFKDLYVKVLVLLLSFLAPLRPIFFTISFLLIVDLITGLLAVKKKKQKITSAGLSQTISKTLVYETVIILAYVLQKGIVGDEIPICNIASAYIGLVEFCSILENLNVISDQPVVKALIKKIKFKADNIS